MGWPLVAPRAGLLGTSPVPPRAALLQMTVLVATLARGVPPNWMSSEFRMHARFPGRLMSPNPMVEVVRPPGMAILIAPAMALLMAMLIGLEVALLPLIAVLLCDIRIPPLISMSPVPMIVMFRACYRGLPVLPPTTPVPLDPALITTGPFVELATQQRFLVGMPTASADRAAARPVLFRTVVGP